MSAPPLQSPTSGAPLAPDTPWSLSDGRERWPLVDGIAYLRTGRDALVRAALARLDAGDRDGALVLLLADQDDWWDGPAPEAAALRELVRERDRLTLRDAMARLAYGRVGDYFAHRWSDPTFVAGLALLEAHWSEPATAFELACGIGHYLRELSRRGVAVAGADVVFSKLWLARHWVVGPACELVCFDAARPWPVADRRVDLAVCHDAFYFLEPKREIGAKLHAMAGTVAISHVHNREAPTFSAGAAITVDELLSLFPDAVVYDDAELTDAAQEERAPNPRPASELRAAEAFSVASGRHLRRQPRRLDGRLTLPSRAVRLRRNPLYAAANGAGAVIAWPSERYRAEYAARATYPARSDLPAVVDPGAWTDAQARRRELVDLPERW